MLRAFSAVTVTHLELQTERLRLRIGMALDREIKLTPDAELLHLFVMNL